MLCVASVLAAAPLAALAAPPAAHALSMDEAVKSAEARYHATVVKAETQKEGARTVYVLRLYNKSAGKVWSVRMDAANGSILQ
jgi:uncharacterized membrane protein YkoI